MVEESILEKLKKIQSHVNENKNVNEAANAAAALTAMLLKYNLSLDDLEAYAAKKKKNIISKMKEGRTRNRSNWEIHLANVIANANLCYIITHGNDIEWFGTDSNIEVAQYITDTATRDIQHIADNTWTAILLARQGKIKFDLTYELKTIHGKEWKNTFYFGAIAGIRERLKKEVEELKQIPNMNAMIVLNDQEIKDAVKAKYPVLRSTNYSYKDNSGFGAGKRFGSQYQFKTGVGSGGASSTKQLKG